MDETAGSYPQATQKRSTPAWVCDGESDPFYIDKTGDERYPGDALIAIWYRCAPDRTIFRYQITLSVPKERNQLDVLLKSIEQMGDDAAATRTRQLIVETQHYLEESRQELARLEEGPPNSL